MTFKSFSLQNNLEFFILSFLSVLDPLPKLTDRAEYLRARQASSHTH